MHNCEVKTMKRLAFSTLILLSATAATAQTPAPDTGYTRDGPQQLEQRQRYVTASGGKDAGPSTTPSSRPPRCAASAN